MLVSEGLTLTPGYPPAGGGADFAPWTQGTPSAEPAGASLLGVSIQCPEVYVARFLQQVCVCVCVMGVVKLVEEKGCGFSFNCSVVPKVPGQVFCYLTWERERDEMWY